MKPLGIWVLAAAAFCIAATHVAAQQKSEDPGPIVARVDGQDIFLRDLEAAKLQLPAEYHAMPLEELYDPLLTRLIRTRVLASKARELKQHQSDLHKRRIALLEDRLLEVALIEGEVRKRLTEEMLLERYRKTVINSPDNQEIRARHILVETEDEAIDIVRLLSQGADFATIAAEASIGPSKDKGGDLGYFRRGQMVPEFEQAALTLKKGQYTRNPVKTKFGWHIILVEDRRAAAPPPFRKVRQKLVQDLSGQIASKVAGDLIAKADIERFDISGGPPRLRRAPDKR